MGREARVESLVPGGGLAFIDRIRSQGEREVQVSRNAVAAELDEAHDASEGVRITGVGVVFDQLKLFLAHAGTCDTTLSETIRGIRIETAHLEILVVQE